MILVPSLRNARERANSTSCQNNLRQFGIAMGRYMSDWKGYFIYPGVGSVQNVKAGGLGSSIWTLNDGSTKDTGKYNSILGSGGSSGAQPDSWQNFVASYLTNQVTLSGLSAGMPSVRVCPSVLRELKAGNYFNPAATNCFKGSRNEKDWEGEDYEVVDFESSWDANDNLILVNYFTTYAINAGQCGVDRKKISANTIAFIDWNAREGWGAYIAYTNWMFNNTAKGIVQDTFKGTNWWLTETGFHHKEGTNRCANYVAMDGHVGSVGINEINSSYFSSIGPQ